MVPAAERSGGAGVDVAADRTTPRRDQGWVDADDTVATIARRLRDDCQVVASQSSVRHWIATHFAEEVAREKVTVPRGPVDPGPEAQIDYGRRAQVGDPSGAVFTLSTLRD